MTRNSLVLAAAALIAAAPGLAQQNPSGAALPADVMQPLALAELAPAELEGAEVLGKDGEEIGQITRIVFTSTGEMDAAVISSGGFLGFGRRSVAIPLSELRFAALPEDPATLVVQAPLTQAELKAMPDIGADAAATE